MIYAPPIKFCSDYPKLHGQEYPKLLYVEVVHKVNDDLREYDCKRLDGSYYELPKGRLIHLTFLGDKRIPFSTLRKYTTKKFEDYVIHVGHYFNIEIDLGVITFCDSCKCMTHTVVGKCGKCSAIKENKFKK